MITITVLNVILKSLSIYKCSYLGVHVSYCWNIAWWDREVKNFTTEPAQEWIVICTGSLFTLRNPGSPLLRINGEQGSYRIHSNSSTLSMSKTWSWYVMMGPKSDLKIIREQNNCKYIKAVHHESMHSYDTEIINCTHFCLPGDWGWAGECL